MGKEKRLFLLAVMTVMMSTVGYSAQITVGNKENKKNETVLEVGKETGVDNKGTFTNNNTINVNTSEETGVFGINNTGGISTNDGIITAQKENKGTAIRISGGTVTNSSTGRIELNGGKGIYISAGKNQTPILNNENIIEINGGTGINVQSGTVFNTATGNININKTNTGILLAHNNSSFNNEGKITIQSGATSGDTNNAIKISKGELKNSGTIENGDKILIEDGKFTNEKGGTVNNAGEVIISGGTFNNADGTVTNSGKINISGGNLQHNSGIIINKAAGNIEINSSSGIAMEVNGELKNEAGGTITINSTGKDSIGIQELKNGNIINEGEIKINSSGENSTGIHIKNGKFNNKNQITINITGKNGKSHGIKNNGSDSENNGTITIYSNGGDYSAGLYINGGKFTNKKDIIIKEANATSYGIKQDNGEFINDGSIEVEKGVGVKVTGGTFTNNENITVKASGIGIDQTKGSFTNNGTIDVNGQGAKGVQTSGTNSIEKTSNSGTINVNGQSAIGMYSYSGGTVTNDKKINVGSSEKGAEQYSVGMKAYAADGKIGNAENKKEIIVIGSGVTANGMAAEIKQGSTGEAIITNNGNSLDDLATITVQGKNISAMSAKNTGARAENGEFGKISVFDNAVGIKLENNAVGVNSGTIDVQQGIGVTLKGGSLFVNSGTINGVTEAIKSMGGNNTVYLKNGSKITGKIVGADGIDVLGLGTGTYSDLTVNNYEALTVRDGDVKIENSTINLEYNKGTETYLDEANKNMNKHDNKTENEAVSGNLTMADTTLAVNFKDSLTNKEIENPIINVGKDGTLKFEKGMTLVLDSSDGRQKFDIYDALGLDKNNGKIELGGTVDEVFNKTAVWDYYMDSNGRLTAEKESYDNVVSKSQLKDFASLLDKQEIGSTGLGGAITALETLKTQEAFTNAVTQMSGGVHGYIVDFAALNARTLTNTMRNRALTRDYMRKRPLNSWTQDISYIDNNHRLGGLMNVDYTEKGVLGISEKQILPNGRIGLVYGGSKGNAKFENGANGSSSLDGAYFGGYYNHEFNDKWSLNSNANFVYTHNKVTRNVDLTYGEGENKVENPIFKSAYPTYTVGMGTSLVYTVKDDLRNKAHFYAGVDVERIMVGNINENKNTNANDENTGLAVKTTSYNAKSYYSIVPSAGFMVQNTGYVFDRKYRIGADLNWETEVGNIKDGKRIKLTGLDKEYKLETSERENVFSYSLFGALDLTESLSVNARYTSMFSDEYDADMIGAGFEYKMDTMADNFFGTLAHKIENNRPFSDRWGGTLGIMMETDDADDYTSYFEGVSSGDVATSNQYKPKITLSLNDKQSNWSYFFEAYHKTNNMFGSIKADEKESHAARYHAEARWNDTYSKGTYGMSFGYRNENSDKSDYYSTYGERKRIKTGTHELRLTPSFSYNLGHNFTLSGKSAVVFMYKYEGDREGQMDLNTESQIGVTYTGFMPRWSMTMNFYREDTWYDHSNRKPTWKKDEGIVGYNYAVPKRDQVNQLRPSITYYFGNGASFRFDARIPLGNGDWANNIDGTKGNEGYETRYGLNYYHPVTPGLTLNVGGTFLSSKTKNKDHLGGKYGNITRGYAFRPNIGFYYSF